MRRFYHPHIPKIGQEIHLDEKSSHHFLRVVGVAKNEQVEVFDGKGNACIAVLQEAKKRAAILEIKDVLEIAIQDPVTYWLLVALVRPDPFANLLRMATEIGVHHIVPFHCTRSVQRRGKRDRWEKIILSAVQQCGRYDIPKVHETLHFEQALELVADIDQKWIFHPAEDMAFSKDIESREEIVQKKVIVVGPEGGFTPSEIQLAKQKKCVQKSLGSFIFRTDTAVAVILSHVKFGRQ
jgi:16S rRNA (uracil1498-N3)-methyltransferase